MNVLAFDTCFDACSAAAGRGLRSLTPDIAFLWEPMSTGHAERLMPMIEAVMSEAKLAFKDLDRITVANGPGTFTGTRIAVAAARALSLATGAPIVPMTSLRMMAMSPYIPAGPSRRLAIATDARRGEVYCEVFDRHTMRTLMPPAVMPLTDAPGMLAGDAITIAGSGGQALAAALRDAGIDAEAIVPGLLPDAFNALFESSEWPVSDVVAPLYLRPPDAKPPASAVISGAGA